MKLPQYEGIVYRSLRSQEIENIEAFWEKYSPGEIVIELAYTSSSITVYDSSFDIQMTIQCKRGRDMRQINPEEQEILFPRGTPFLVERKEGNRLWLTEL